MEPIRPEPERVRQIQGHTSCPKPGVCRSLGENDGDGDVDEDEDADDDNVHGGNNDDDNDGDDDGNRMYTVQTVNRRAAG